MNNVFSRSQEVKYSSRSKLQVENGSNRKCRSQVYELRNKTETNGASTSLLIKPNIMHQNSSSIFICSNTMKKHNSYDVQEKAHLFCLTKACNVLLEKLIQLNTLCFRNSCTTSVMELGEQAYGVVAAVEIHATELKYAHRIQIIR